MVPGRSQKRTSTYSMFLSLASLKISSGVLSDTETPFAWPNCAIAACHNSRTPRGFPHPGTIAHRRLLGGQIFPGGVGGDSAVDDELRARRIGGFVAGQIEDEIGHLDRLNRTAKRRSDDVVGKMSRHGCAYQPGMDRVDADVVAPEFDRGRLCQPAHCPLGGDVGVCERGTPQTFN